MGPRHSPAIASALLFVDDDDNWSFIFQEELKKAAPDKIVITARDGREAIRNLTRGDIHILVTDIRLPGMSGIELIKWVRSHPRGQLRPIVVHSGSENIADRQQCALLGVDSFLEKPASLDALRANIRFILKIWDDSLSYSGNAMAARALHP